MDLYKDKSNINLPQYIQSINFDKTKLKTIIVNTQKCVYDLKISEINERIQRLEEQNRELESNLKGVDCFIKILQEEKTKEISDLKSQIVSYSIRIRAYKQQLIIVEKARINDKFTHTAITINMDEKYKNMGLILTSQIKLLSAKTNILEDYKSIQHILEKKLDMRSQSLINEKEQVAENLCKIEYKFRIDRKRLKKELYNRLLELVSTFQHEVSKHMSRPIPNLLSENIAVKNQLLMITDSASSKTQDYVLHTNAIKYIKKINTYLRTTKFIVISELKKSTIKMLHDIRKEANVNLSKLFKFNYFTEEQYITNKDNAKILARKCEMRMKYVELLLYSEKEKLTIAENQKQWISDQLQKQLQILYDVTYVLKNFKMKNKQS